LEPTRPVRRNTRQSPWSRLLAVGGITTGLAGAAALVVAAFAVAFALWPSARDNLDKFVEGTSLRTEGVLEQDEADTAEPSGTDEVVVEVAEEPSPEPVARPKPEPAEEEPPPPPTDAAYVLLTGDASQVRLVGDVGTFASYAPIPPGTYAIKATFGLWKGVEAGSIKLGPGQVAEVECSEATMSCALTP